MAIFPFPGIQRLPVAGMPSDLPTTEAPRAVWLGRKVEVLEYGQMRNYRSKDLSSVGEEGDVPTKITQWQRITLRDCGTGEVASHLVYLRDLSYLPSFGASLNANARLYAASPASSTVERPFIPGILDAPRRHLSHISRTRVFRGVAAPEQTVWGGTISSPGTRADATAGAAGRASPLSIDSDVTMQSGDEPPAAMSDMNVRVIGGHRNNNETPPNGVSVIAYAMPPILGRADTSLDSLS